MPETKKWDRKTEAAVDAMRAFFRGSPRPTHSLQQKASTKDRAVRGRMWISRTTFPPPSQDDDVLQVLLQGIRGLGVEGWEMSPSAELASVDAEWTGYRGGVDVEAPEPRLTEAEKYHCLVNEATSDVTILYVHGGSYIRGAPARFRHIVSRLAQLTGGHCASIQYRLAPQNPFPAALLDVATAYLSLLYPTASCVHQPVFKSNILLVGESAGASLCLSFMQLILHLHRQTPPRKSVRYHGQDVLLPLPAGVTAFSVYGDMSHSLPSWTSNAKYDYFNQGNPSQIASDSPPCDIWPSNPPRGAVYCDIKALSHPLVSPVMAESWVNGPPMFLSCGEEMSADSNMIVAQRAASQGCAVVWAQYEALPHIFPILLDHLPQTRDVLERFARFCKDCVERPQSIRTEGTYVDVSMKSREVDLNHLTALTFDEVKRTITEKVESMDQEFKSRNGISPPLKL